jgi:hypothetical protein
MIAKLQVIARLNNGAMSTIAAKLSIQGTIFLCEGVTLLMDTWSHILELHGT